MLVSTNVLRPKCNCTVDCMPQPYVFCLWREILAARHCVGYGSRTLRVSRDSSQRPLAKLLPYNLPFINSVHSIFMYFFFLLETLKRFPQTFKMLFFTIKRANRFYKISFSYIRTYTSKIGGIQNKRVKSLKKGYIY